MDPLKIDLNEEIENFFYNLIQEYPGKGSMNGVGFGDLMDKFAPPGYLQGLLFTAWEKVQIDLKGKFSKAFEGNPNQAAFLCDKWFVCCLDMKLFLDPEKDKQRIVNNFKKISLNEPPVTQLQALKEKKRKAEIDGRKVKATKIKLNVINGMILRDGRKAVAHILCGEVFRLDPVIGDAACEMRPPFILDMCGLILQMVGPEKLLELQLLGRAYLKSWKEFEFKLLEAFDEEKALGYFEAPQNTKEPSIYLCDQIFIILDEQLNLDSKFHYDFIEFCKFVEGNIGAENFEYLGLCKAMTTTRLMIYDRLGISLGDFQIDNLPPVIRGDFKVRLGTHSNRYIREITGKLTNLCTTPTPTSLFPQLNNFMTCCNVDLYTDSKSVPILPIYEGMRAITTYELMQGRPLVFVFNRMVIKVADTQATHNNLPLQTLHVPNEIACVSFDPIVIMYVPNQTSGRYVVVDDISVELSNTPCTVYECWSVLNPSDVPNDLSDPILAGLYSPDKDQFIAAIKQCDIAHLMQLYAASHPPMGGRATPQSSANITHANFNLDGGLSCTLELHKRALSGGDKIRIESLHNNAFAKLDQLKIDLDILEKEAAAELVPLDNNLKQTREAAKAKTTEGDAAKKLVPGLEGKFKLASKKWDEILAKPRLVYQELLESTLLVEEEKILASGEILPLTFQPQLLCTASGNLADEFINYRKTSMTCGMLFNLNSIQNGCPSQVVYHIKLKTPDDSDCSFQYRYNRSIFFRISHILPSTYAKTWQRVELIKISILDYPIGCLIDMTTPAKDLESAKANEKDTYYRDDQ